MVLIQKNIKIKELSTSVAPPFFKKFFEIYKVFAICI